MIFKIVQKHENNSWFQGSQKYKIIIPQNRNVLSDKIWDKNIEIL